MNIIDDLQNIILFIRMLAPTSRSLLVTHSFILAAFASTLRASCRRSRRCQTQTTLGQPHNYRHHQINISIHNWVTES